MNYPNQEKHLAQCKVFLFSNPLPLLEFSN